MAFWQLADQAIPHLCEDKPGGTTGEQERPCNLGFQRGGSKASKPLAVKTYECFSGGRNSQPHNRVHCRDPQGPRMYTYPPTWNQHWKG